MQLVVLSCLLAVAAAESGQASDALESSLLLAPLGLRASQSSLLPWQVSRHLHRDQCLQHPHQQLPPRQELLARMKLLPLLAMPVL